MMKKRLSVLSALVMCVALTWAQGPNDSGIYYQAADGKSGTELKSAMFNIIKLPSKAPLSYGDLYEAYKKTDTRADGYVRDWYSNATNYRHGVDNNGNYSKEGDMYNREHSVPQSWFNEASPMKSDIIHVLPTDGYVNNRRSNYPLAEVANVTYSSKNAYSKLGSCKTTGYSGTVFEPNDEIKGDMARIYFYMATGYMDKISNWSGGIFSSSGLVKWTLDMMMRWSKQDPVDAVEIARNAAVCETQGNRNPFVDYPGLEEYIWGDKQDVVFSYDNYGANEQYAVARPTFSPDEGSYYESVDITINCATEGATIYYTLNGADASEQSTLYEGPFTLNEIGTYNIRAIAIKDGERSAQASATYIIQEPSGGGQGGEGGEGGNEETPADCEIALNNALFGTSYTGAMNNVTDDLTGSSNGITVTYQLGTGNNRYCNDSQIRVYPGNKLTVSVSQGNMTEIELVLAESSTKELVASTGTVNGYKWTGKTTAVNFSINASSGHIKISSLKIKVDAPTGINFVQTGTRLAGQRVIYDLSGRRVVHPTKGLYIVDGRKVVIR